MHTFSSFPNKFLVFFYFYRSLNQTEEHFGAISIFVCIWQWYIYFIEIIRFIAFFLFNISAVMTKAVTLVQFTIKHFFSNLFKDYQKHTYLSRDDLDNSRFSVPFDFLAIWLNGPVLRMRLQKPRLRYICSIRCGTISKGLNAKQMSLLQPLPTMMTSPYGYNVSLWDFTQGTANQPFLPKRSFCLNKILNKICKNIYMRYITLHFPFWELTGRYL